LPRDDAPVGELRGALSQSAGRRLERPGRSRSPISTESFRLRRGFTLRHLGSRKSSSGLYRKSMRSGCSSKRSAGT